MYFYAQADNTVSLHNPGFGFCNTKHAHIFASRKERDAWIAARLDYDYTCQKLTRQQAYKMASSYEDQKIFYSASLNDCQQYDLIFIKI
jgi:hypothetical protein